MSQLLLHKKHIDNFLSKFKDDIKYIYGGITENGLEKRRQSHITDKEPSVCNSTWLISQKAITTINIKDINKLEYYKFLITEIEQYLIDELANKYDNKCKNDRNKNGTIAQKGGAGVKIKNLQLGDAVKFYIFYELK